MQFRQHVTCFIVRTEMKVKEVAMISMNKRTVAIAAAVYLALLVGAVCFCWIIMSNGPGSLPPPTRGGVVPSVPGTKSGGAMLCGSLLSLLAFAIFDAWLWKKAVQKKNEVLNDRSLTTVEEKLQILKEKSFWFELPLYVGLFGTVFGFLVISFFESLAEVGRVVSYSSTLAGILTTVLINKSVADSRIELLKSKQRTK